MYSFLHSSLDSKSFQSGLDLAIAAVRFFLILFLLRLFSCSMINWLSRISIITSMFSFYLWFLRPLLSNDIKTYLADKLVNHVWESNEFAYAALPCIEICLWAIEAWLNWLVKCQGGIRSSLWTFKTDTYCERQPLSGLFLFKLLSGGCWYDI